MSRVAALESLRRRFSRGGKEVFWVAVGQVASLAGIFIGMKLFTHLLTQEEYGRLALGLSIAGIASMFTFGPIGQGILRYFSVHRNSDTMPVYFRVIQRDLSMALALIFCLTMFAGFILGETLGPSWRNLMFAAGAFTILAGIGDSLNSLAVARRWRTYVAFYQGGGAWLRILFAAAALVVGSRTGHWVVLGYALGAGLSLISLLFAFHRAGDHRAWLDGGTVSGEILGGAQKEFRAYITPFLFFAGFAAISMYADRWVIQTWLSEAEVGLYFAVMQIANAPMALFFGILSQAVVPVIFGHASLAEHGAQARAVSLIRFSVLVSLPVAAVVIVVAWLFDDGIMRIFTTPEYATMPGLLGLGVLSCALFNLAQFLVVHGLAQHRPAVYFWPKVLQAMSFLLAAPFFISAWELFGVAWALCLSSILYLLAVILVNHRLADSA